MNRRSLLLGIGSALAAPAIVKADTLMKLWVPKREFIAYAGQAHLFNGTIWVVNWPTPALGWHPLAPDDFPVLPSPP